VLTLFLARFEFHVYFGHQDNMEFVALELSHTYAFIASIRLQPVD
jgi:uncharacterized protein YqgQ